jgi:hypothetical protein
LLQVDASLVAYAINRTGMPIAYGMACGIAEIAGMP